jgi:periplasmic protein CpxP/Spy
MKYLLSFLLFGLSLITLAAQNGDHMKMMSDFTPEQQAILKTKKMAVQLDLSSSQQDRILVLNKKMAADHKKRMKSHKAIMENDKKPTSDERFKMMNEMLDTQIAHQNEMKKILDADQYATWKKSKMHKKSSMKSSMHKKGMKDKMSKEGMHKKDASGSGSSKHKEMMKEKNKS